MMLNLFYKTVPIQIKVLFSKWENHYKTIAFSLTPIQNQYETNDFPLIPMQNLSKTLVCDWFLCKTNVKRAFKFISMQSHCKTIAFLIHSYAEP